MKPELPKAKDFSGKVSVETVQATVCESFEISLRQMLAKRKPNFIAWPRQIAMVLSWELSDMGLLEVAKAFKKNQGAVTHAMENVRNRCETEPETTGKLVKELREYLTKQTAK